MNQTPHSKGFETTPNDADVVDAAATSVVGVSPERGNEAEITIRNRDPKDLFGFQSVVIF